MLYQLTNLLLFFLLFFFHFLIPVFPCVFVPEILDVVFIKIMKIGSSIALSHLIRSVSAVSVDVKLY